MPGPEIVLAYIGIGPGIEFVPSFLGLMGLAATAVLAVLQWPLLALLRRWRRFRD